jgi:hypothetical protein
MSMPKKPTGDTTSGRKPDPADPQRKIMDPKVPGKGMAGPSKDTPKQGPPAQGTGPGRK